MAIVCPVLPQPDNFVSGMISFLDCQAINLGSDGFQALSAPGSSAATMLGAMLTIFVAIIGYRMLFGETPTVREGVLSFVKIGIVLAFATSWLAYRPVIFDVVLRAPADLASEIGRPSGLPGAAGGLPGRLDGVDRGFRTVAIYGIGVPTREQVETSGGVAPPLFSGFDAFALGGARVLFLVGSIGAFAVVRLGAGLLLALGPLFFAFLLFDGTRGLFEGWLRTLIGLALGSVAVAIVLGVELALLEPWLADLAVRRSLGIAVPGISAPVFAVALVFTLVLAALLRMMVRVAGAMRLPRLSPQIGATITQLEPSMLDRNYAVTERRTAAAAGRSRATIIADSIAATEAREAKGISGMGHVPATFGASRATAGGVTAVASASSGRSYRRRTTRRVSIGAGVRDRGV